MRTLTIFQTLSAAAAIALIMGCSDGGSPFAPRAASQQDRSASLMGGFPGAVSKSSDNSQPTHHFVSYDSCAATGPIEYVSDARNSVIYIYKGPFAGQSPCGQITSGLHTPYGLYVQTTTHDLYVANYGGSGVLVFHRGQISAYNHYIDPTDEFTSDVTVTGDGTVIASNQAQVHGQQDGSLSTWIGGRRGGTFVGNFQMASPIATGTFITNDASGTVYFDDFRCTTLCGELWTVKCPAGACGAQTQVAGVAFNFPGGMAFDASGDLLITDAGPPGIAQIFELPNPNPTTFPLGKAPFGMAISQRYHHWFVAYSNNPSTGHDAAEYSYPSGTLIGTVPCCTGGVAIGVAVDQ
jgi:hypothetical protein